MPRWSRALAWVSTSVVCLVASGIAQRPVGHPAQTQSDKPSGWVSLLADRDSKGQKKAVEAATAERRQAVKVLEGILSQARTEQNRYQIAAAIQIAGQLRAGELSQLLVEKIDFFADPPEPWTRRRPPEETYIAVAALMEIGNPSIAPVLASLSLETDISRRSLCLVALKRIVGIEVGNVILKDAIAKAETENQKKNLQKGLEAFNWTPPKTD